MELAEFRYENSECLECAHRGPLGVVDLGRFRLHVLAPKAGLEPLLRGWQRLDWGVEHSRSGERRRLHPVAAEQGVDTRPGDVDVGPESRRVNKGFASADGPLAIRERLVEAAAGVHEFVGRAGEGGVRLERLPGRAEGTGGVGDGLELPRLCVAVGCRELVGDGEELKALPSDGFERTGAGDPPVELVAGGAPPVVDGGFEPVVEVRGVPVGGDGTPSPEPDRLGAE